MFDQRSQDGTAYDLVGPEVITAEAAPVIVLIHGLGLCRELWADYVGDFSQHFRVLNYDLYGHGDSAPAIEATSLNVYADQLARLLDELGIVKAAIVGFSIGGMINRRFAMDYPERVLALCILNSPHNRGEHAQLEVEKTAKEVSEQGVIATLDKALARWFTSDFREHHPEVLAQVTAWLAKADANSYAQARWVLANGVRELTQDKLAIDAPTLVLTCENDTGSTPAMSGQIQNQINNAELYTIPTLQHLGLLQEPQLFINVLQGFLHKSLLRESR